jgi:uncharacterized repeat protein (TIGR03803 family)
MRGKRLFIGLRDILAIFALAVFVTGSAASQEQVLHSFGNGTDGQFPYAGLIMDGAGNLYGTTFQGGIYNAPYGCGTVFELSPNGGGSWTEKLLRSFNCDADGSGPNANLLIDASGNLYGTTTYGGPNNAGLVFELSPQADGGWTETVLHSFGNGTDGANPYAGLIFDNAGGVGNLYGTTSGGGIHSWGTAFELAPQENGDWTEKVLHSFNDDGADAAGPYAGLTMDRYGILYGTTRFGGIHYAGAVFDLVPNGSGGWTEKVLHSFGNGTDGAYPDGGLVIDLFENIYSTTRGGGIHTCNNIPNSCGTVFWMSPHGSGGYSETVLHSFGNGNDGANPYAGVIMDDFTGNLYGTTISGGIHGNGTAFELMPNGSGGWTETVLRSFGSGTDGINPYGGLILDGAGNLYGTTEDGGIHGAGTVFEITP